MRYVKRDVKSALKLIIQSGSEATNIYPPIKLISTFRAMAVSAVRISE